MEHTKTYQEFKKNGNTKFVRYSEGAEMYHMSVSKFMQMAKDAKAIYKLGQLVLVNLKIFDEYIETWAAYLFCIARLFSSKRTCSYQSILFAFTWWNTESISGICID